MAVAPVCPDVRILEQLSLGQMSPDEVERLAEHVAHCEQCVRTLQKLKAEDTLVEAMAAQSTASDEPRSESVNALIDRLKALRPSEDAPRGEGTIPNAATPSSANSLVAEGPSGSEPVPELCDFLAPAEGPDEIGRLGGYRVLKVLGAGGMGVVFQAEDLQLQRHVALKAMRPALAASASARQRFLREARAMAALRHDHVVTVYQVGEDRGVPFLAMEHLEGETLDALLQRGGRLHPDEVVRIAREVALGLAAAHARGLIHRDVKPGNIWLEHRPGEPGGLSPRSSSESRVKLLDFGLARPSGDPRLTQSGLIVGTPAYMAPEQARGEDVDGRADLFSLGCVLYRLCTGEMPFRGVDVMSTLLAVAMDRARPPRELNAAVPPALSDLVMKLLSKEPAGRPESARTVVTALDEIRHTATRPPESPTEQLTPAPSPTTRRPASPRRRRPLLAAAVLLAVLLPLGWFFGGAVVRFATNRGELVVEVDDPDVEITVKQQGVVVADRATKREFVLTAGEGEIEVYEKESGLKLATRKFTLTRGGRERIRVTLEQAKARPGPRPKPPAPEVEQTSKAGEPLSPLAIVQRPTAIKGVRSWTIETRGHRGYVEGVSYSPDGSRLATAGGDGTVRVWDAGTGQLSRTLIGHAAMILCLAWSPDGKTLASAGEDNTLRFWDLAAGRLVHTCRGHKAAVHAMAWSPDGKSLAAIDRAGTIRVWDPRSGASLNVFRSEGARARNVAWSRDGKVVAAGWDERIVWVREASTWRLLHRLEGHVGPVRWAAFSPDGKTLASTGQEHVRLWDLSSGQALRVLRGPASDLQVVAWSPDSKRVVAWDAEKMHLWDAGSDQLRHTLRGDFWSAAWSPDSKTLATGDRKGTVRIRDAVSGQVQMTLAGNGGPGLSLAWPPDGKTLAIRSYIPGVIWVWDLAAGRPRRVHREFDVLNMLTWSPDGRALAVASLNNVAWLWDSETGKTLHTLKTNKDYDLHLLAWSPDGKSVASGSLEGVVRLWDAASGKVRTTLTGHKSGNYALAWSPDGKVLASGDCNTTVRLWDARTGKELHRLAAVPGTCGVNAIAWSPDGKTLACGYQHHGMTLWDVESGRLRHTCEAGDVKHLAWLPDGKTLVSHSSDRLARTWEARSGKLLSTRELPAVGTLSADGRLLASVDLSPNLVGLWEADSGRPRGTVVLLDDDRWMTVNADGHFKGSPGVEQELVHVVQTERGQETLSPDEFAKRFGWKNDPVRVRLTGK